MMRRLGGWTRLWILLSAIWLVAVGFVTTQNVRTMGLQIVESRPLDGGPSTYYYPRLRIVGKGLLLWLLPVGAVYGLGAGTRWVWRGFTQTPTT